MIDVGFLVILAIGGAIYYHWFFHSK